jgi:hypothetical protein
MHHRLRRLRGLAGDPRTCLVDGVHLFSKTMARKAERVGPEGVGLDDFGARGEIAVVDGADQFRL